MATKYRCSEQCGFVSEIEPRHFEVCPSCGSNSIEFVEPRNNREALRDLIDDADDYTLVFIRERLLTICEQYIKTPIEELQAQFGITGAFGPGMANMYARAAKEVDAAIGFKETVAA